jgi:hypothetical protein
MANVSNELMYEALKSVQAQVAIIREDVTMIKTGVTSLDHRLGIIHTDMAAFSDRMDRIESHLGRVETRLNLTGA